jgi:drug/metabolite transporter (DMT)-like permease
MEPASVMSSAVILGGAAALVAALLWAFVAVIFRKIGENIPPAELNLLKGLLAVTALILTSLLLKEKLPAIASFTLFLLAMSGIVGIGIGDTAYFFSLNHLGTRLSLLMGVLAPPFAGLISWIFLGEILGPLSWLGIFITLAGVGWVILQENRSETVIPNLRKGLWFALLASLSQAIGAVISRYALISSDISALQTAIVRLLAGIACLVVIVVFFQKTRFQWLRNPKSSGISTRRLLGLIALVSLFGTYIAVWLQQVSLEYAPTGIAQTLLSTSPIFILPIAALRGEKVTWKAVIGVIVSLAGVLLLFSFG